jgi:hypothetical protein
MFDERLCQPSSSRNENTEPYDDHPSFSTKVPEKMKRFLLKGVRGITDDSAYRPFEDTNDTSESSHNPSENQNLNNAADLSDHRAPVQNKKDTSSTNTDNDYTKVKRFIYILPPATRHVLIAVCSIFSRCYVLFIVFL